MAEGRVKLYVYSMENSLTYRERHIRVFWIGSGAGRPAAEDDIPQLFALCSNVLHAVLQGVWQHPCTLNPASKQHAGLTHKLQLECILVLNECQNAM